MFHWDKSGALPLSLSFSPLRDIWWKLFLVLITRRWGKEEIKVVPWFITSPRSSRTGPVVNYTEGINSFPPSSLIHRVGRELFKPGRNLKLHFVPSTLSKWFFIYWLFQLGLGQLWQGVLTIVFQHFGANTLESSLKFTFCVLPWSLVNLI